MGITSVANVKAQIAGGSTVTTAAIDTTGAQLIEITVASYFGGVAPVITDSKSNTWNPLAIRFLSPNERVQKWYAYCSTPGKCGTGHTFTVTASNSFSTMFVRAYAATGILSYIGESAGGTVTGTSVAIGSQTPPGDGALFTAGMCSGDTTVSALAITGGLAIDYDLGASGVNMMGAAAYLVQSVAAALNPVWSWTTTCHVAVNGALYLERFITVQNQSPFALNITQSVQPYTLSSLNSHIAQAPSGFYVQQLPMFRFVKVKKADGTWANIFTVFGILMKMPDGTWQVVGDFQ